MNVTQPPRATIDGIATLQRRPARRLESGRTHLGAPCVPLRVLPSREMAPLEPRMPVAVQRAAATMKERYDEPLTLNSLAAEVFVSPFHFCRMFAKATGVTPGRYLTAVRLFEAKRLLLTTSHTVSDIVCSVGYSSVGTFTTRFTRAVGMTPSQYRDPRIQDLLLAVSPHYHRLPSPAALPADDAAAPGSASVTAVVDLPRDRPPADLLVGVFAESIPQCAPVAFACVRDTGSTMVTLDGVPPGRWVVLAAAEHRDGDGAVADFSFGLSAHPITVTGGGTVPVRVPARALRPTDAPIAITLAPRSERPTRPAVARRHAIAA